MSYFAFWDGISDELDILDQNKEDGQYSFEYRKKNEGFGVLSSIKMHRLQLKQESCYSLHLVFSEEHPAYPEVIDFLSQKGYVLPLSLTDDFHPKIILWPELCEYTELTQFLNLLSNKLTLPPIPIARLREVNLSLAKDNFQLQQTQTELASKEPNLSLLWEAAFQEVKRVQAYASRSPLQGKPFQYHYPILITVLTALEPYLTEADYFEQMENLFQDLMKNIQVVQHKTLIKLMILRANVWLSVASLISDEDEKKDMYRKILEFQAYPKFLDPTETKKQFELFDSTLFNLLKIEDYQSAHRQFDDLKGINHKCSLISSYLLKVIDLTSANKHQLMASSPKKSMS